MEIVEVSVTESPKQKVVAPPGVMVGVEGIAFTVTTTGAETADVHPPAITKVV